MSCSTTNWRKSAHRFFMTTRSIVLRLTDSTTMSRFLTVSRYSSPMSHWTAYSTKTRIMTVFFRTVASNLIDDPYQVSQNIETGLFFYTALLSILLNVSGPSLLRSWRPRSVLISAPKVPNTFSKPQKLWKKYKNFWKFSELSHNIESFFS